MGERISVLIVDDSKQLRDSVRTMLEFEEGIAVVGEAEDGEEAVAKATELRPHVILMDINMPKMDGLAATRAILRDVSTNVIIISVQGDADYLRRGMQSGARDFLAKPFTVDELVTAIKNACRTGELNALYTRASTAAAGKSGKVISFFSTKGGVGKTTLAANLAVALAVKTRAQVALVDLDLEFGVMATMFGLKPNTSIVDLCRVDGPLKAELVERVMVPSSNGLVSVLASPPSPEQAAEVDGEARGAKDRNYVGEILGLLKQTYAYVVVDTATSFRDGVLTALDRSDLVYVVTTPDIPTLHNTAKCLDILLTRLEYPQTKVRLVLNRADGTMGLSHDDITRGLDYGISYFVPSDGQTATWAANSGQPFVLRKAKTPLADTVHQMARDLAEPPAAAAPSAAAAAEEETVARKGRKGLFSLLHG
ncbi:MAG: response regulator [Firmicutes bacterium]|nr:response regulator [Bacillota bacterium]